MANHPCDQLFQVAHVAGIFTREQIFAHRVIKPGRIVGSQLFDEILRERPDVLSPSHSTGRWRNRLPSAIVSFASPSATGNPN